MLVSHATGPPASAPAQGPSVSGRYRLDHEMGRGGMGRVYRATDLFSGRVVALKHVCSTDKRLLVMLEREFHTLVGLRHPRIIEVYDYGLADDGQGAYYTMELLDGEDLRDLSPVDYRKACSYLRDVASSLALLHVRRLLHRDLSPRNVRITSDERAKLIDFGGLSGFGIPELVVGTPPCVPPEALHQAALDQRADLFALGALAYWVLTGRHAYRARELTALPEVWRQPPAPPSLVLAHLGSAALPPIPAELDELVMALLTLNPLGRPATAAEVIDRLSVIGDLPREPDSLASKSYLLGIESVGRERERERLRRRLSSAVEGRGACVTIEAAAGMGATRLLSEVSVEAQLAGALPVLVDGRMFRGPYGAVHGLIDQILKVAREEALAEALPDAPILARVSPSLARELDIAPDDSDLSATPGELRKRTQSALRGWLLRLSQARPLLIAVDNMQEVDDSSASLLATLAAEAGRYPLLLVVAFTGKAAATTARGFGVPRAAPGRLSTVHPYSERDGQPAALRALRDAGATMVLRGLTPEEVQQLVGLLFGAADHGERLAGYMHRLTGGSPRACMDLAEHLVSVGAVRYVGGGWVLPQELPEAELPRSVEQTTAARLSRLEPAACRLAEALSVHRGGIPLPRCIRVATAEEVEPFGALELLVRENVLSRAGALYHFTHEGVRDALRARVGEARMRVLHLRIGELIADEASADLNSRLDAGWHLLNGGDETRGADLLASAGLEVQASSDDTSLAVPALRAALAIYRKQGRPDHERLRLLGPLAMGGYYSDRRLADEFAEETLATFQRVLGLSLAARLSRVLGRFVGTYLGLGWGLSRLVWQRGARGWSEFNELVRSFVACGVGLAGTATICLDGSLAAQRARVIEPLTVLGKDSAPAWAYRLAQLLSLIPEDRMAQARTMGLPLLERLRDPRPIAFLTPDLRTQVHGGALFALGVLECYRDGPAPLAYADQLDALDVKLYTMAADRIRYLYHTIRGELELAVRFRQRVEVHAMQAGSAWQVEVWGPSADLAIGVLAGDTIALKRVAEQLDLLAREIPSLRQHAALARAEYHHLKGEHDVGFALARPHLDGEPRAFIGWGAAQGNHARALNLAGRHREALDVLDWALAHLDEEDHEIVVQYLTLRRERATAYAGLGDVATANEIIHGLLARHAAMSNPMLRGGLHETAAQIALRAGEVAAALEHLTHVEHFFKPTGNPSLISRCERLRRQVRALVEGETAVSTDEARSDTEHGVESAQSLLSHCQGADERAEFALRLLLKHVGGREGYLFAASDGLPELIAPLHGDEPSPSLVARVEAELRGAAADHAEGQEATVVTAGRRPTSSMPAPEPRRVYRIFALTIQEPNELRVLGAVAVLQGEQPLSPPQSRFVQTVARSLFDAGELGVTRVR